MLPPTLKVCAIVQAHNEGNSILNVLRQLTRAKVAFVLVVANGCNDATAETASSYFRQKELHGKVLVVAQPLGPDVAKAIGTYAALRQDWPVDAMIYIDGDWLGSFGPTVEGMIVEAASLGSDVVFTARNELPWQHQSVRPDLSVWRAALKQVRPEIQYAAVSESPMLVQKRVFRQISPYWLHHPGLWLAHCVDVQEHIDIATVQNSIARSVGNPTRNARHQARMLDTLIGDAVEGSRLMLGLRPHRRYQGKQRDGYHSSRRIDSLLQYMDNVVLSGLGVPVSYF